jgi:hypothetical protein
VPDGENITWATSRESSLLIIPGPQVVDTLASRSKGTTWPISVTTGTCRRISLATFDGRRHVHPAEASRHDLVDHHRVHAVPGRLVAVDLEFQVRLAHDDVRVHRAGVDQMVAFQVFGHRNRSLGQPVQTVAVDPHRHRRLDTALQHHDAALNWLQGRGGRDAGQRGHRIDLVPDFALRHAGAPLVARLQHDIGFDHARGRRVERRIGPADFAQHVFDFGNLSDHRVLRLQHFHRLIETRGRIQAGHVEPRSLIECDPVVGLEPGEEMLGFDVAGHLVQIGAQRAGDVLDGPQQRGQPDPGPQPQEQNGERQRQHQHLAP